MLMDKETIITLYRESVENGDPKEQIKSLAKTNNCPVAKIRKILEDAGEDVPRLRQAREPEEEPEPAKKAVSFNDVADAMEEVVNAVYRGVEETKRAEEAKRVGNMSAPDPLPEPVKKCIIKGLNDIEAEIKKKQEELALLEAEYHTLYEYIYEAEYVQQT